MLSEISHTEKDKYHMVSVIGGIQKKKKKTKLNKKQIYRYREQNSGYQKGRDVVGGQNK